MTDTKTRFQQIRENDLNARMPAAPDTTAEQYPGASNTRNLCLAWADGRRIFLNYSYLIAGQYLPDNGCIELTFTTHKISIHGLRLEGLLMELMDQLPRIITCTDQRYKALADQDAPAIQDIIVTPLE